MVIAGLKAAAFARRAAPLAILVAAVVWIGFLTLQGKVVKTERDNLLSWQGSITIAVQAADPPDSGGKIDPASIPTRIAVIADNGRKWKAEAQRLSAEVDRMRERGDIARRAAQEARQSAREAGADRRALSERLRSSAPVDGVPVLSQETWSKM